MRRHVTTLATTLVIAIAALATGCTTPAQTGANTSASTNAQASVTTLKVVNQAFLDMDVYVIPQSGGRQRLGTATGNSSTVMRIPSNLIFGATTLRFIADPVGGSHAEVSTSIMVTPGDQVIMTIPPQ